MTYNSRAVIMPSPFHGKGLTAVPVIKKNNHNPTAKKMAAGQRAQWVCVVVESCDVRLFPGHRQ